MTVFSCLSGEATDTFGIAPDDSSRFASNAKIAGAFACDPGSTAGSGLDSQFLQIPCPFLSLPLHGKSYLHFQIQVARRSILLPLTLTVEGGFLDQDGKEDIKLSPSPDAIVGDVRKVRQQIKASRFPDLPLYSGGDSGSYVFSLPMRSNDAVLVTLERIKKSRSPNRPVGGTQP